MKMILRKSFRFILQDMVLIPAIILALIGWMLAETVKGIFILLTIPAFIVILASVYIFAKRALKILDEDEEGD